MTKSEIRRRFEIEDKGSPNLSTFINYCRVIRGNKLSDRTVKETFMELVDKDDYDMENVTEILDWVLAQRG